jgi:hypothetical protein
VCRNCTISLPTSPFLWAIHQGFVSPSKSAPDGNGELASEIKVVAVKRSYLFFGKGGQPCAEASAFFQYSVVGLTLLLLQYSLFKQLECSIQA